MLLATDAKDGNGLQLEKVGPTFSSSSIVLLLVMVCFSFEKSHDVFLLLLKEHFIRRNCNVLTKYQQTAVDIVPLLVMVTGLSGVQFRD